MGQSGESSRWRVCYQRGLPRLVYSDLYLRKLYVDNFYNCCSSHSTRFRRSARVFLPLHYTSSGFNSTMWCTQIPAQLPWAWILLYFDWILSADLHLLLFFSPRYPDGTGQLQHGPIRVSICSMQVIRWILSLCCNRPFHCKPLIQWNCVIYPGRKIRHNFGNLFRMLIKLSLQQAYN